MSRDRLDPVFFALSDPTRRDVIRHLSQDGPVTLAELASELPVTRQAVAKHLAQLEEAGLVASSEEAGRRRYLLTPGPFADAMGWMMDVGAEWDDRLEALRRHVEGPSKGG